MKKAARLTPKGVLETFNSKHIKDPATQCWPWQGQTRKGYGVFIMSAHRYAYEQFVGPVPKGLELDHICRNRRCVNPAHLEPVTIAENNRRRPRRSHCPKGHPFTLDNTLARVTRSGKTAGKRGRLCRACGRAHYRAWYKAKRAAGLALRKRNGRSVWVTA